MKIYKCKIIKKPFNFEFASKLWENICSTTETINSMNNPTDLFTVLIPSIEKVASEASASSLDVSTPSMKGNKYSNY